MTADDVPNTAAFELTTEDEKTYARETKARLADVLALSQDGGTPEDRQFLEDVGDAMRYIATFPKARVRLDEWLKDAEQRREAFAGLKGMDKVHRVREYIKEDRIAFREFIGDVIATCQRESARLKVAVTVIKKIDSRLAGLLADHPIGEGSLSRIPEFNAGRRGRE